MTEQKQPSGGNQLQTIITAAIVAVVVVIAVGVLRPQRGVESGSSEEPTVYSRVISSGKLRAAYITYPPAVMKNTSTGELSGTFVEILEEVAKNLGLELEWTEEVGWGAQIEGLNTDRYDIVGSPVWANPTRGKMTTMSIPVYYSGIGVWVRNDESRFDQDFSKINDPEVRIGTIDGETADLIARTLYPKAQRISSPQLTSISEKFLQLQTNKIDVVFAEPFFGFQFLKNNPATLKNVAAERPIKVLGNCYMFKTREVQMKHMIDVAVEDLINSGFVDRIIDKYEPFPGTFYRAANPYKPNPPRGAVID